MPRRLNLTRLLPCLTSLLLASPLFAETALIAVASNFSQPARELASAFEAESEHRIELAFGASGKLATQVINGAPFAAFLSADQAKVEMLVERGLAQADSQATYALGRLALWSATPDLAIGEEWLRQARFERLALANPRVAPYGHAAQQVLRAFGVPEDSRAIVRGENVSQTYQFVVSGAAQAGFIARSQLAAASAEAGSLWLVPARYHAPIRQDLVLLTRGDKNQAARAFLAFVLGPAAQKRLLAFGYDSPEAGAVGNHDGS